jgi:hypothetical protein
MAQVGRGDFAGHDLATLRLVAVRRRTDGAGGFFSSGIRQLPEIAVIEKPANHVRRDQLGTKRVKLVPGREL